jgi:hypothetical protein
MLQAKPFRLLRFFSAIFDDNLYVGWFVTLPLGRRSSLLLDRQVAHGEECNRCRDGFCGPDQPS